MSTICQCAQPILSGLIDTCQRGLFLRSCSSHYLSIEMHRLASDVTLHLFSSWMWDVPGWVELSREHPQLSKCAGAAELERLHPSTG